MKKIWKLLLLSIVIWNCSSFREVTFKPVNINSSNKVINLMGDPTYIDTILYIGMDSLELKDVSVIIRPFNKITIPDEILSKGTKYKALISGENNIYILNILPCSRQDAIRLIAHELIHLKQFVSGRLLFCKDYTFWRGRKVEQKQYYEDRPWEQEAFAEQPYLIRKINATLYQSK